MKKLLLTIFAALAVTLATNAATLSSLTWAEVCQGKMGDAWYGTEEAMEVADILLSVQKNNGGWMKNDQFHKLTASELAVRQSTTSIDGLRGHSCFDNYATTQEMRFLVRVYNATRQQKYLDAFKKALDLIITAGQGKSGGWGQYWPNSGEGSYQDYITFNDDLMTNMMKILQDVYENKGSFAGLVDEATRAKCKTAFDAALQCVLNCQIDDNGVKAAWCAQHDPVDFLPTEGRPHEEPSVSAYESSTLLTYLMTLENPSEELKECIVAAVKWLKEHKYKENCYIEDVKDANGNTIDRRIADKSGSNVWGRFIQIGGESGKKVYEKFYNKLKTRGKKRQHHLTGFTYYEYQILEESYDPTKEYQPIFSVYTDKYPELFYRHLYIYEDAPDKTDIHGQTVITSLPAENRKSYQYLGSWPDKVFAAYPAWCSKNGIGGNEGTTMYAFIDGAVEGGYSTITYTDGAKMILLNSAKAWSKGSNITIGDLPYTTTKVSNGAQNKFIAPEGKYVTKVTFYSYLNLAAKNRPAYWKEINGVQYSLDGAEGTKTTTEMKSFKDFANPDVYTYNLGGVKEFTFTNTGEQACFVMEVEYGNPDATLAVKGNAAAGRARVVAGKNGVEVQGAKAVYSIGGQLK